VRRALELDPYYTAQKYLLSIELAADDPALSVIPDLSGEKSFGEAGEQFVFDQRLLDEDEPAEGRDGGVGGQNLAPLQVLGDRGRFGGDARMRPEKMSGPNGIE